MVKATDTLVITLDTWRFATRSKKSAIQYAQRGRTQFVGLASAGRTRRWDAPGEFVEDGVDVLTLAMVQPATRPSVMNHLRNIARCYVPALARLIKEVWTRPAEVIHVTSSALAPLGALHKLRHRSRVVLDITERPGEVATQGSLAAWFSRCERLVLRLVSPHVSVVSVPVEGIIPTVEKLGFARIELVRNAPLSSWRAPYKDPHETEAGTIRLAIIGSIFEGRGYEILMEALAMALPERSIEVLLAGPGRDEYVRALEALAEKLGVAHAIRWLGSIESEEVSATYLEAHVGLVLYESLDPGNDGLSNKILECVSTGRPVLAGNLPENRSFVTTHGVGFLTGVTPAELASALRGLPPSAELVDLARHCRRIGDEWLCWEKEFAALMRAA